MPDLLSPVGLGDLTLPNRVVMAPMTRSRAVGEGVASASAAIYYSQRAAAGLIITEGSQISPGARGYIGTPGIHSDEQIAAWRHVTDAVHARGGRIFLQLWHVGRVSHSYFRDGEPPIAPSALPVVGEAFTPDGPVAIPLPRELRGDEIPALVQEFAQGARNAMTAGFDGVEIHGANGYLLDQFLRDGANRRADAYGGSPAGRARFPLEVVEAVVGICGAGRVGYRMSPWFDMYSMSDSDPAATFGHLASELAGRLAYLHVIEPVFGPGAVGPAQRLTAQLRAAFGGPVIANGGYDKASADQTITDGRADLVSFGLPYIANPDLVERFAAGATLAVPNQPSIYGGGDAGYIDYPAMA